jgi:hypothetical protein
MIDISKIKKLADEIEKETKKQFGNDVRSMMNLWVYAEESTCRGGIMRFLLVPITILTASHFGCFRMEINFQHFCLQIFAWLLIWESIHIYGEGKNYDE